MGRVYPLLAALAMLIGLTWPLAASAHSGHGTDASTAVAQVTAERQAVSAVQKTEMSAPATPECDDICCDDGCCDDGCCPPSGRCCSAAIDLPAGFAARTPLNIRGGLGLATNPRAGPPGPASDIDHPPSIA
jgi:hypothetical protein